MVKHLSTNKICPIHESKNGKEKKKSGVSSNQRSWDRMISADELIFFTDASTSFSCSSSTKSVLFKMIRSAKAICSTLSFSTPNMAWKGEVSRSDKLSLGGWRQCFFMFPSTLKENRDFLTIFQCSWNLFGFSVPISKKLCICKYIYIYIDIDNTVHDNTTPSGFSSCKCWMMCLASTTVMIPSNV